MELWKCEFPSLLISYILVQAVYAKEKPSQRSSSRRFKSIIFRDDLLHALDAERIEVAYVETGKHCLLKCVKNLQCFSTNIGVHPRTDGRVLCELLSSDKYSSSKSFRANASFHHYRISSPCESFPCQNDGTCLALHETSDYSCKCHQNYTGVNCEDLWISSIGQVRKYYKYFSQDSSWFNARSYCQSLEGTLVILRNENEHNFVTSQVLPLTYHRVWIGLSDPEKSWEWKWGDGSSLSFNRWGGGEPNNKGYENCVEMIEVYHTWNDYPCGNTRPGFICERTAVEKEDYDEVIGNDNDDDHVNDDNDGDDDGNDDDGDDGGDDDDGSDDVKR